MKMNADELRVLADTMDVLDQAVIRVTGEIIFYNDNDMFRVCVWRNEDDPYTVVEVES